MVRNVPFSRIFPGAFSAPGNFSYCDVFWQNVPEPTSATLTAIFMTKMRSSSFPTSSTGSCIILSSIRGNILKYRQPQTEQDWGEIDHEIVRRKSEDDEVLCDYSKLLNRLSGLADEMSSHFRRMRKKKDDMRQSNLSRKHKYQISFDTQQISGVDRHWEFLISNVCSSGKASFGLIFA